MKCPDRSLQKQSAAPESHGPLIRCRGVRAITEQRGVCLSGIFPRSEKKLCVPDEAGGLVQVRHAETTLSRGRVGRADDAVADSGVSRFD
jgi:hypothetical protein